MLPPAGGGIRPAPASFIMVPVPAPAPLVEPRMVPAGAVVPGVPRVVLDVVPGALGGVLVPGAGAAVVPGEGGAAVLPGAGAAVFVPGWAAGVVGSVAGVPGL